VLEHTAQADPTADPGSIHDWQNTQATPSGPRARWPLGFLCCALGLLACVLLVVTPLKRIPDSVLQLHLAAGEVLAVVSAWLPLHLGAFSQANSAALECAGLLLLAFLCYGLGALLVSRQSEQSALRIWRGLIWAAALLAGAILLVTPAMLSHDILVYAGYSRLMAVYHANPYFVPIASFPHDPFSALNYWGRSVAAYGPLWLLVCAFPGWLLPPDPGAYVIAFRLFALAIHLLNIWLIGSTLRTMGRSSQTITLGMLLYAWNPLLLLESSLGGHNDGLMISFVLLGALFAARAQQRGLVLRPRGFLPAVAAFTLAALVKFTALPILAVYMLFLGCQALRSTVQHPYTFRRALHDWRRALPIMLSSLLTALLLALACYGPLWVGHSLQSIRVSLQSPPSALGAENSFMRSIIEWLHLHPDQIHNGLLQLLSTRRFWDDLTLGAVTLCLLAGARLLWSRPEQRTFALVSLLTLCTVLMLTAWFFSWYLTWPLTLAALSLPCRQERMATALLALTLVFSASALSTYLFTIGLFGSHYYLVSLFTTLPAAGAFLLTLVCWRPARTSITGEQG
jgi:hypothetical protein